MLEEARKLNRSGAQAVKGAIEDFSSTLGSELAAKLSEDSAKKMSAMIGDVEVPLGDIEDSDIKREQLGEAATTIKTDETHAKQIDDGIDDFRNPHQTRSRTRRRMEIEKQEEIVASEYMQAKYIKNKVDSYVY